MRLALTFLIHLFFIGNFSIIYAQNVGIGANIFTPDSSAGLELQFSNKGLLIPRVALTDANDIITISSPALSLLVFNTGTGGLTPAGYFYWNGVQWRQLLETASGSSDPAWLLEGNSGTIPGTGGGQNFLGTTDQQDLILATNSTNMMHFKWGGSILMTGDFENQDILGDFVTYGDPAITDPAATSLVGGPNASTLWLSSAMLVCPSCNNTYYQELPHLSSSAEVLDGCTQSITITDGSGTDNSGVLIMANVTIKTTTNGTLPNVFRYAIWVQRSTDPTFSTDTYNIYKIEDGVASGNTTTGNTGAGISLSTIVYPDLNLAPGTYYYRLVFQSILASTLGLIPYAQDRSMVLLQIKR